jgi:hypothetical protein
MNFFHWTMEAVFRPAGRHAVWPRRPEPGSIKGGQNTRYPIPEPELPEPRSEVPEPELPDHNFG